jgi:hypothetical protein
LHQLDECLAQAFRILLQDRPRPLRKFGIIGETFYMRGLLLDPPS